MTAFVKCTLMIAGLLSLSGCSSPARRTDPPNPFPDRQWSVQEEARLEPQEFDSSWWTPFGDPVLSSLLQKMAQDSPELRAAEMRIRRAQALREEEASLRRPLLSASADVSRLKSSTVSRQEFGGDAEVDQWDAGLRARWELDLFGRLEKRVKSAEARQVLEQERRRDLLIRLLNETAVTYVEVRGNQRELEIVFQNQELLQKTLELAIKLFELGETSEFDVVRARGQLEILEARLPELEARIRAASNRLSVLLGTEPQEVWNELKHSAGLPEPPEIPSLGLTSDLVERRPDLRAAAAALRAAEAESGAARRDRLPRFSLIGEYGRRGENSDDLAETESERYRGTLGFDWPIWEGGRLRAREEVRGTELGEAEILYEQQVREAFVEVENALLRTLAERDVAERLRAAETSRLRAVELARDLYTVGEADFLSVLDAERELISVQDSLVLSETRVLLEIIRLRAALGGGWEVFEE